MRQIDTQKTIIRKSTKGSRRRRKLLLLSLLGFLVWSGITFVGQMDHLKAQEAQLEDLQQELATLQQQNEEYQQEVIKLHDPEYIEQLARREYFLSKPGETLFITPETRSK